LTQYKKTPISDKIKIEMFALSLILLGLQTVRKLQNQNRIADQKLVFLYNYCTNNIYLSLSFALFRKDFDVFFNGINLAS
jgi:hypothetical protein